MPTNARTTQLLPAIIEQFYDAAIRPGGWQAAIDLLNTAMPSVAFALYGHDYRSNANTGQIYSGFDPRAMQDFARYYSQVNVWARGFSEAPVGSLVTSESFLSRDEVKRSEYYNDWLRPQGGQITGWGSVLYNDKRRFLAISSTLRERDADGLDDELRGLIQSVLPHVQRAFRLAGEVARQGQTEVRSWIELLGGPAFALDRTGAVLASNRRAPEAAGAVSYAGQKLLLKDAEAQRMLDRIVRDIATQGSSLAGNIGITTPAGERWSGLVTPAPPTLTASGSLLLEYLPRRAVAILILHPVPDDAATRLRRRYALSPAEADVALMLGEGLTVGEIADRRQASTHTVRNQLRHVFDKTGVNRQAELLRLILER